MSREITTRERGISGVATLGAPLSVQQSIEKQQWKPDQRNYWDDLEHLRTNPLPGETLAHSTGVEESRITKLGTLVRERRTLWAATKDGIDIWELARPLQPRGHQMTPVGQWALIEHQQQRFLPGKTVRQGNVPSTVTTGKRGRGDDTNTKWDVVGGVLDVLPGPVQDGVLGTMPEPSSIEGALCRYTEGGVPTSFTAAVLAHSGDDVLVLQAQKDQPRRGRLDSAPWNVTQISATIDRGTAALGGSQGAGRIGSGARGQVTR